MFCRCAPRGLTIRVLGGGRHDLVAALDPHNAGVLIVQLPGAPGAGGGARGGAGAGAGDREMGGALGAEDITRRLGARNGDGQCVVM